MKTRHARQIRAGIMYARDIKAKRRTRRDVPSPDSGSLFARAYRNEMINLGGYFDW